MCTKTQSLIILKVGNVLVSSVAGVSNAVVLILLMIWYDNR